MISIEQFSLVKWESYSFYEKEDGPSVAEEDES
jgi:hypothetical protein